MIHPSELEADFSTALEPPRNGTLSYSNRKSYLSNYIVQAFFGAKDQSSSPPPLDFESEAGMG